MGWAREEPTRAGARRRSESTSLGVVSRTLTESSRGAHRSQADVYSEDEMVDGWRQTPWHFRRVWDNDLLGRVLYNHRHSERRMSIVRRCSYKYTIMTGNATVKHWQELPNGATRTSKGEKKNTRTLTTIVCGSTYGAKPQTTLPDQTLCFLWLVHVMSD